MVETASGRSRLILRAGVFYLVLYTADLGQSNPALAEWDFVAGQKISFTTDAFQFSSVRRLQLSEDPSLPSVVPLDKPEDVIWEPTLEATKSVTTSYGRTDVSVRGRGFIFTNNPKFTHGDYRLQIRHQIDPTTAVYVRYRHAPNLLLGPNFERQTGQRLIVDERVTTNKWRLDLERRLTSDLTGTLIGRVGLRKYNDAFSERDTKLWTVGPRLDYRVLPWVHAHVTYLFERGHADGAGDVRLNDDVSYRLHHVAAGLDLTIAPRWLLALVYTYQQKNFTSDLVADTHFGRRDQVHQGLAELEYQVTPAALLTLSVQHTQRVSTNELREFKDTIVSIGGQYRF